MRPLHIAALVGLIAAAGLLFVLTRRGGGGDEAGEARRATRDSEPGGSVAGERGGASSAEQPAKARPTLEGSGAPGAAERDQFEAIGEDGTRVRDYRGTGAPIRDPNAPLTVPFQNKRIDAAVVATMGREMKSAAKRCKSEHAADVGDGASVRPRTTFSIQGERLTVTSVVIAVTAIKENSGFTSCMETAALGVTVEAPGHRDVDKDTMAIPIKL